MNGPLLRDVAFLDLLVLFPAVTLNRNLTPSRREQENAQRNNDQESGFPSHHQKDYRTTIAIQGSEHHDTIITFGPRFGFPLRFAGMFEFGAKTSRSTALFIFYKKIAVLINLFKAFDMVEKSQLYHHGILRVPDYSSELKFSDITT